MNSRERVMRALRESGADRNTLVFFLSDNGDMMGDYLLGGKQLLYDASIRVPMLALDPRAAPAAKGKRRTELVLNIDIAPTLLDLAGLPVPAMMQGRSLVPLLEGADSGTPPAAYCDSVNMLTYNFAGGMREELGAMLAKVSGLSVRGGQSVMRYRDHPETLPEIARELEALTALWRRVVQGEGRAVVLEGEAGIGKSRLVDEFDTEE